MKLEWEISSTTSLAFIQSSNNDFFAATGATSSNIARFVGASPSVDTRSPSSSNKLAAVAALVANDDVALDDTDITPSPSPALAARCDNDDSPRRAYGSMSSIERPACRRRAISTLRVKHLLIAND
jgi:hypothetical protein